MRRVLSHAAPYFSSSAPVPREQRDRELRAMLAREHHVVLAGGSAIKSMLGLFGFITEGKPHFS